MKHLQNHFQKEPQGTRRTTPTLAKHPLTNTAGTTELKDETKAEKQTGTHTTRNHTDPPLS
jgi:hypothetical protein